MLAVPGAQANVSGDYCKAQSIGPGGECVHLVQHHFIETEGWSKGGTANCNGVTSGSSWIGWVCNSSGAPPDEAYCTSACAGQNGYAFIHDHSAFSSDVYTGWLNATE